MKLRFTIAQRIWIGFGIMIIALVVYAFLTNATLRNNRRINEQITNNYSPSVNALNNLYEQVNNSKMLIRSWVFIDKKGDSRDKQELRQLHEQKVPAINDQVVRLMSKWTPEQKKAYSHVYSLITDSLFAQHKEIMNSLSDFESYNNALMLFEVIPKVEEGGEIMKISDRILSELTDLSNKQEAMVIAAIDEMDRAFAAFKTFIFIMTIILIFVAVMIAFLTISSLVKPINHIKHTLLSMSKGVLPEMNANEGADEIGQMSKALNELVRGLKGISDFSLQIGKGNFESDFQPLGENDILGNALINMRGELKKAAEDEEKRKREDAQRNWSTLGLAKFSEILRENTNSLEDLSYNIIGNLVKYLDANQGALFITNNNDEAEVFLEIMACYAYDRKKFLEKKILIGEGLVGRCVQEKETIYLTDIPEEYIKIRSGLGQNNPRSLLLVPLALNEQIHGVIEVASFTAMENFQIEFVEKIAESIASTIATVRINIQTNLLLEQSRQQAEEMSAQEEEMRQNMEELRATQEQSARREADLEKQLEDIKSHVKGDHKQG
jgi:methyl-accepting chemotaxis protein